MRNKKKPEFSLLFNNENAITKEDLYSIRGGSICGNVYVVGPVLGCGGILYIGIGAMEAL